MTQSGPSFIDLLKEVKISAVHLEMRDSYGVSDERADFERWQRTGERDVDPGSEYWGLWVEIVSGLVRQGVSIRRARIVSEPVTDYIRYEYAGTAVNIGAGESVRWLPRRRASDIALPGNDFWLLDGKVVRFGHFSGDGEYLGDEITDDPRTAELCESAFEAVWERATPHDQFSI
ncbi:DUF6879 family protein [Streptomyces sp. CB01881]|uniref:DUF6879 family protein n=1 Tax=Streptomyces sp. CB01881 TaxID=2078691 RepID=UPI000CDBF4E8|nr:DUF6879 family protein [Streptomyces sp. CB01881]AUY51405.1 hypothetical protein C2142_23510 [Streptomyces sp. CB01881]TYC74795.1 hypothetical protein EH183_23495 [Streptomyces sp. CB01881]